MKKIISLCLVFSLCLVAAFSGVCSVLDAKAETVSTYKEEVHLTFDGDAPYGIPGHRKAVLEYANDGENGYLKLSNPKNSGAQSYIGIDGTVGQTPVSVASTNTTDKETAYDNLFKCQAGTTYKLQFDYKYLAGTGGSSRNMDICVMTNPLNTTADSNYDLSNRTTVLESDPASQSWTAVDNALSNDTEWDTAYYIFTVSSDDTAGICVGISPGYNATYATYAAVDNISISAVKEVFSYNESRMHTMDILDEAFINGSGCTATQVTDTEQGSVLKIVGTGSARGGFSDLKMEKNKKYYISFDAKADVADTQPVLVLGVNGSRSQNCRHFIAGFNYQDYGTEIYVDGVQVTATTVKYSTTWQRYGLIIDTSDAVLIDKTNKYQATFWEQDIHFLFGVQDGTAYFDNVQLIEVTSVSDAVPSNTTAFPASSIRAEKKAVNNGGVYQSAGLRFRGSVSNDTKSTADEIGFVIAPSSISVNDSDWYSFENGINPDAKTGTWYIKDSKDIIYSEDTNFTYYQLILTGLSNESGKNLFVRRFAAVMYVKVGDNYTYYSIGETSYNETKAKYAVRNIEFDNSTEELTDLKVMMIGNSFCYHFTDELYEIAAAKGYNLVIGNLYYPGCFVKQHWEWLQNDTANYQFYITDKYGHRETSIKTLQAALDADDWNVITLQQHMSLSLMPNYDTVWASIDPYAKNLYDHIRVNNPSATLYWQETWAHEVGFDGFGYTMPDAEYQATVAAVIKQASEAVCEQNNVPMIPSGDAWTLARTMSEVGDNLCNQESGNDKYHDGDIGGGQYLNACVWFEVLTGKSCIGNTWRPDYELSEEKIAALQLAAHQAVAEIYGHNYAQ